jgi:hypothetical protein
LQRSAAWLKPMEQRSLSNPDESRPKHTAQHCCSDQPL